MTTKNSQVTGTSSYRAFDLETNSQHFCLSAISTHISSWIIGTLMGRFNIEMFLLFIIKELHKCSDKTNV